MVDIYSRADDLECTENYDRVYELKDRLKEGFLEFCSEEIIDFTWLSDRHIAVDDEEDAESLEDDIETALDCIYNEFMEELEEEDDEEEEDF